MADIACSWLTLEDLRTADRMDREADERNSQELVDFLLWALCAIDVLIGLTSK